LLHFSVAGLPSKTVSEVPDLVCCASATIAITLPPTKLPITRHPPPANLPKSGSYFSLKIVLAFHTTLEMIQQDATENVRALGYLLLDD